MKKNLLFLRFYLPIQANSVWLLLMFLSLASFNAKAQAPIITSFTPLSAKPGDAVTLTGTGFSTTATNNVVFFGATKATVTSSSSTSITATVPIGATYAPITLLNTATSLAAYSQTNFNPIYSPPKKNITVNDFQQNVDFLAGSQPSSVAVGDLDGDGKPDIVVTNSETGSNTISVYLNTSSRGSLSSSSFAPKVDFVAGDSPYSVTIGDLDGDGKAELAIANVSSTYISILYNKSSVGIINTSSFEPKVDFNVGYGPYSIAIGDLDGDGKPDLAVSNVSLSSISVLRNTSTLGGITLTSFSNKIDFATESGSVSVAMGDLDGDGKPDLVSCNVSNTISVLRNTTTLGNITSASFANKVDFTTGITPISVAIGDLDGDSKPDLVVANQNSNSVSTFRNTSSSGTITSASFAAKVDFATGNVPYSVSIGDVNGDGRPDLATANLGSSTISIIRNKSTVGSITSSSFAAKVDLPTGDAPFAVAISDFDGDTKPDLTTANVSGSMSIVRNLDIQPIITEISPSSASPGDLFSIRGYNFSTTAANNIVMFGATRANIVSSTSHRIFATVPVGATYAPITVLNIENGLAASSQANFNPVFSPAKINITATDFQPKVDFTAGTQPTSIAIGDIDGDGKSDVVVVNIESNTISIYHNISSSGSITVGSFSEKVDFATGVQPYAVAIGDLDGDGKPDLAVTNVGADNVSIFYNTSSSGSITSTSFAAKVDFATGYNPFSVSISDLDGDGKPDLAVANLNSNDVSILHNISVTGGITTGSFEPKIDFATGVAPYSVDLADLDGDGKPDLAVANAVSNNVSILRNTTIGGITSGSFAAKVDFATVSQPNSIAIGDIDGDGKLDLAVTNSGSNSVSVFRNTSATGSISTGSFASKVNFITSTQPYSVAMGDLNGDGKPDLAVANLSGTVSTLLNTSTSGGITTGAFGAKVDFATGSTPYSVAIGDLDGDGRPDFAVANYGSASISILRNADIVTLPVDVKTFNAKLNSDGTVKLNWLTATETNNSYFEILRSVNNLDFVSLGKVAGAGTSNQEKLYNFTDQSPLDGTNYYQLVQYDKDGQKKVLGIRSVNASLKVNELMVYPNPSNGLFNLSFDANNYQKLEVIDLTGRIFIAKTIGKQANAISFDISKLSTGVYNVRLTGEGKLITKRIIKQ